MPNWDDAIRSQRASALTRSERQGVRVVLDRFTTKERLKGVLRSYLGWAGVSIPIAIAIAKFFLDHGAK